jgi:hypothetical protein
LGENEAADWTTFAAAGTLMRRSNVKTMGRMVVSRGMKFNEREFVGDEKELSVPNSRQRASGRGYSG